MKYLIAIMMLCACTLVQGAGQRSSGNVRTDGFAQGVRGTMNWSPSYPTALGNYSPSAWWNVSSLTGYTNGQPVMSMPDRSSSGFTMVQSNVTYSPLYTNAVVNGQPALKFTTASMTAGDVLDVRTGSISVFFVMNPSTVGRTYFSKTFAGSATGRYWWGGDEEAWSQFWSTLQLLTSSVSTNTFTVRTFSYSRASKITSLRKQGVQIKATNADTGVAPDANISNPFQIGGWNTADNAAGSFTGYFCEMLVYLQDLSSNDIVQVEGYLNRKYNLY